MVLPEQLKITKKVIKDSAPNNCYRCALAVAFSEKLNIFAPDVVAVTFNTISFRINNEEKRVKLGHALQYWLERYDQAPLTVPTIDICLQEHGTLVYELHPKYKNKFINYGDTNYSTTES